jgi:hypothetical protein
VVLQALCACKITAWNEEYTSGMFPFKVTALLT